MDEYKRLLLNNKAWVIDKLNVREDFFLRMAEGQQPKYLWIGCSDSRVPAEEITGTHPGDIFVHRNIANMVVHTDFSMLSVLQYAVDVLQVKHIIVCGHYGCGGVQTAMSNKDLGLINNWLRNIKDVYRSNVQELNAITDDNARFRRMVELNVVEQVQHLAETSIVQSSWKARNLPSIHGWVYDLHTGLLQEVVKVEAGTMPADIYIYE